MSDILAVGSRLNGATLEFFDKATGRTVAAYDSGFGHLAVATFTATLAQINAGKAIIAADANRTIIPVYFWFLLAGSFTTLTDIRLSDTAGSPVDVVTLAQAQAADALVVTPAGGTGVTVGAGFGAALTAGKGLQIRKTGSSGAGGTSISGHVLYALG